MEGVFEVWVHFTSYISLGTLFFMVTWSMVEKVTRDIFPDVARFVSFIIATYGFWCALMPILRIPYLVILSAVAILGTFISRLRIIVKWMGRTSNKKWLLVALALVSFEIIQQVILILLRAYFPYSLVADLISWGLVGYGISTEVRTELIEPVIASMRLPRANLIQTAFVIASVIFVPVEFPEVDMLISLAAIFGVLFGWHYFTRRINV